MNQTDADAPKRLVVIGGGPKAMAVVAKKAALDAYGWSTPEVVVVDQTALAANWLGSEGYTDGLQPLGTPPEKDIGFPYSSDCWDGDDRHVNEWMLRLSWQSFLASGADASRPSYAEWVDRGRPQPTHRKWGQYLRWVGASVSTDFKVARVEQVGLSRDGARWALKLAGSACSGSASDEILECDGLLITGPGPAVAACPGEPEDCPFILDGRSYWLPAGNPLRASTGPVGVCVIGSGETAAAIAVDLVQKLPPASTVDIVATHGVIYSRGESYEENRLFSDPSGWDLLTRDDRDQFVNRTDKSVFSMHAKSVLNNAPGVRARAGRVTEIHAEGERVFVWTRYAAGEPEDERYDYVICAVGFDAAWFLKIMSGEARAAVASAAHTASEDEGGTRLQPSEVEDVDATGSSEKVVVATLRECISHDLSVLDLRPRLHLPMLASLTQGPGFPNLSSLGLLSDRVLRPYATKDV